MPRARLAYCDIDLHAHIIPYPRSNPSTSLEVPPSARPGAATAMEIDGVDGGPKRDSRTRRGRDTGESIEDERTREVTPEASEGGITLYNRNYSSHTKVAILHKNLNLCVIL